MSDINSIWDSKLLEVDIDDVRDNDPRRPRAQWSAREYYRNKEKQEKGIASINNDSRAARSYYTYREMIPNNPMFMIGRECR